MSKEENFLKHTFHDSVLKAMERKDNKLSLIIDTDIYLYPGKPFTFLTLTHPNDYRRVKEMVGGSKYSSENNKARMDRSDKNGKNFRLKMSFHSGREELEIHCYNFWTERKEEYKDYNNTIFK